LRSAECLRADWEVTYTRRHKVVGTISYIIPHTFLLN